MSSYWDYLRRDITNPITSGPAAFIHALYDKAYDESHGANRYWLSKVPILSTNRSLRDAAKQAQDTYDNTGKDPAYISRNPTPGFERVLGDVGASAGTVGMARSLSTMYSAEVIEDVGTKFNGMYR